MRLESSRSTSLRYCNKPFNVEEVATLFSRSFRIIVLARRAQTLAAALTPCLKPLVLYCIGTFVASRLSCSSIVLVLLSSSSSSCSVPLSIFSTFACSTQTETRSLLQYITPPSSKSEDYCFPAYPRHKSTIATLLTVATTTYPTQRPRLSLQIHHGGTWQPYVGLFEPFERPSPGPTIRTTFHHNPA